MTKLTPHVTIWTRATLLVLGHDCRDDVLAVVELDQRGVSLDLEVRPDGSVWRCGETGRVIGVVVGRPREIASVMKLPMAIRADRGGVDDLRVGARVVAVSVRAWTPLTLGQRRAVSGTFEPRAYGCALPLFGDLVFDRGSQVRGMVRAHSREDPSMARSGPVRPLDLDPVFHYRPCHAALLPLGGPGEERTRARDHQSSPVQLQAAMTVRHSSRYEIERRGPHDLSDDAIAVIEIDGFDGRGQPRSARVKRRRDGRSAPTTRNRADCPAQLPRSQRHSGLIGVGSAAMNRWTVLAAVTLASACTPPVVIDREVRVYQTSAGGETAAWFVETTVVRETYTQGTRPRTTSGDVPRTKLFYCHARRVPPCVHFRAEGVPNPGWFRDWLRQGAVEPAPAVPPPPSPSVP